MRAHAQGLLDACATALTATDRPLDVRTLISLARRPRIGIPAALFLVGMIATGGWWVHRSSVRRWAKQEAIPQALVLADKGDYAAAGRTLDFRGLGIVILSHRAPFVVIACRC